MANRPLTFTDYVGQQNIISQLKIMLGASQRTGRALPHFLFAGGAGLGKTTLAQIIANECGVSLRDVMAPSIKSVDDLVEVLCRLSWDEPDVLFIDEIHRLPVQIEEILYTAMEDFKINIPNEDGQLEWFVLPKFTLVGATTLAGEISKPLRDRFRRVFTLSNYNDQDIVTILSKLASREQVEAEQDALLEIARRCKGVARIAISHFESCRDYAEFMTDDQVITNEVVQAQFGMMGIDEIGLDENDHKVLAYLADCNRPMGVAALSAGVNIDRGTIENLIEPYLLQIGLVIRSPRGREITEKGLQWIGGTNGGFELPTQATQRPAGQMRGLNERVR